MEGVYTQNPLSQSMSAVGIYRQEPGCSGFPCRLHTSWTRSVVCGGSRVAIPPFGFHKIEVVACTLMVIGGVAGLLLALTGTGDSVAGAILGHDWPNWFSPRVSLLWLILQSLAVIAGGIGAWRSNSFLLAAVGVASSLVVKTSVGIVSFLPGVLMLMLIVRRHRAFNVFLPRWRGPGPPPPGAWKR
jgi:hypothetical protein